MKRMYYFRLCIFNLLFLFCLCLTVHEVNLGSTYFPELDLISMHQGVVIAIEEANQLSSNIKYNYILLQDNGTIPPIASAYQMGTELANNFNVDAFLTPSPSGLASIINIAKEKQIPVFTELDEQKFFSRDFINVFHFTLKRVSGLYHLMRHMFRYKGCISTGIVITPGLDETEEVIIDITSVFQYAKYPRPGIFYFFPSKENARQQALKFFYDYSANYTCFLFLIADDMANTLLRYVTKDYRYIKGNFYFFGMKGSYGRQHWNNRTKDSYRYFRFLTFLPGVADKKSILPSRFRKEFEIFLQAHPSTFKINNNTYEVAKKFSTTMFMGYILTFYFIELFNSIVSWSGNQSIYPTRKTLVEQVYLRMIIIEDLYFNSCIASCTNELFGQSCFCNVVNKIAIISKVSEESGVALPIRNSEVADSQIVGAAHECNLRLSQPRYILPIHVLSFRSVPNPPFDISQNRMVQVFANDPPEQPYIVSDIFDTIKANRTYEDMIFDALTACKNLDPYVFTYNSAGDLGITVATKLGRPLLFAYGCRSLRIEPKLISRSDGWNENIFNFLAVYSDLIYTTINYYLTVASETYKEYDVYVSSPEYLSLVKQIFHTFGIDPPKKKIRLLSKSSEAEILHKMNNKHFVITVVLWATDLDIPFNCALNATRGGLGLVTSQNFLYKYMSSHDLFNSTNKKFCQECLLVFASPFMEWWSSHTVVFQRLIAQLTPKMVMFPSAVNGFVMGKAIGTIARGAASANKATAALFALKTMSIFGSSYGPFSNKTCSAKIIKKNLNERECQCTKGPRTFYVQGIAAYAANSSVSVTDDFSSYFESCGVPFKSLPKNMKKTYIAIGVTVGIFLLLLLILILVLLYVFDKNKNAPKNENVAFTMAFTDIQSSTVLWSRVPEVMSNAVQQHHDLIRKIIKTRSGYEVKTIGDSFMVAFKDCGNAVQFSIDLQTIFYEEEWPENIDETYMSLFVELADSEEDPEKREAYVTLSNTPAEVYAASWHGIRVRVGVHYGYGSIQKDPVSKRYDYYGTVVNTAARVEGVGHGGQVLLTNSAYEFLESRGKSSFNAVFEGTVCTAMGPQPLRGLDEPVELYQILPENLQNRFFPPLRLDVEKVAEEEEELESEDYTTPGSTAQMTVKERVNALFSNPAEAKKLRLLRIDAQDILIAYHVIRALFSPMSEDDKTKALQAACKAWRVRFSIIKVEKPKDKDKKGASNASESSASNWSKSQSTVDKSTVGGQMIDPFQKTLLALAVKVAGTARSKGEIGHDNKSRSQSIVRNTECSVVKAPKFERGGEKANTNDSVSMEAFNNSLSALSKSMTGFSPIGAETGNYGGIERSISKTDEAEFELSVSNNSQI